MKNLKQPETQTYKQSLYSHIMYMINNIICIAVYNIILCFINVI